MSINLDSLDILRNQDCPVEAIKDILTAAIQAADPYSAVQKNMSCNASQIMVGNKTYSLYPDSRIIVAAIGKASLAMTHAVVDQLGERVSNGVCVCKHNPTNRNRVGNIVIIQGSHPVPDQKSVAAGSQIRDLVAGLSAHDLVILLISGGGSALVCLPAEGIELMDIQTLTTSLLKSGASINELNAVRKHLDTFKGGGFLKMAYPAQVAALVVSDVVNSPLDVIASGPAVADPTTYADAIHICEKYIGQKNIPLSILGRFKRGCAAEIDETLKPNDPITLGANHTIIASNRESAQKAFETAQSSGFNAELLTCELVGEASLAGKYLADLAKKRVGNFRQSVGIAGGETTVQVKGNGSGGRNLEVALGAVRKMSGLKNTLLITLATDGEDGPTDAAGAFVTGVTLDQAQKQGLDPDAYLANNNAYNFFEKVGGLILTGPTGTNVNDLNFIFRF